MTAGTLSHQTSPVERERRHTALRTAMSEAGHDALVIYGRGDEFVRGRIQYVSDIFTWAGWAIVVLPAKGDAVFIVDPLFGLGRASIVDWLTDLRMTQDPGIEIAGILSDLKIASGSVGVAGLSDIAAVGHFEQMKAAAPNVTWADATDLFDDTRAVKSPEELDNFYQTSAILRSVFRGLEAEIRPGVMESDVLAEAHKLARQYGCVDGIAIMGRPPFRTFSPGSNGVIERDDIIVIDLEWGGPAGYWVELRRVFSFGPPPPAAKKFWDARVETFAACVESMKAGNSSDDILVARDRVYAKYGQNADGVLNYTAHGIGLDSLEPPWAPGKERTMLENMVINLHPAIRITDRDEALALGGISIADNILVGPNGGIRMTDPVNEWIVLEP